MLVFKTAFEGHLKANGWKRDKQGRWFHPANTHVRCPNAGDAFDLTPRMRAIVELPTAHVLFTNRPNVVMP